MDTIYNDETFDLEFVTADERRKTGGKIKTIKGGWLARNNERPAGDGQGTKARNHHKNMTRTIHRHDGHPVDVHIYLITKVNGREVTLT